MNVLPVYGMSVSGELVCLSDSLIGCSVNYLTDAIGDKTMGPAVMNKGSISTEE